MRTKSLLLRLTAASFVLPASLLLGCGGGGGETASTPGSPTPATSTTAVQVQGGASSVAAEQTITTLAALPTDAIFAPTSFWYQPIPTTVQLHENSAGLLADFLRQKKQFFGTVTVNQAAYASPVYTIPANVQTKLVAPGDCTVYSGLQKQWMDVPIPDYAVPADGTDSEMTIYQPSSDTMWEFWKAKNTDGVWTGCWGGRMQNVSQNDGRWPETYGATATGLPFLGGQITAEELKRGEIRHVIGIGLPETESWKIRSWPAKRSDGWNPNGAANRIPEGLRFRLDPSVNVDQLAISAAAKVIARAAQKYGFVVWDHSGGIAIRVQNPKTYTLVGQPDPYPALFNNAKSYEILAGFPWDRLQFMPMDYGKP